MIHLLSGLDLTFTNRLGESNDRGFLAANLLEIFNIRFTQNLRSPKEICRIFSNFPIKEDDKAYDISIKLKSPSRSGNITNFSQR